MLLKHIIKGLEKNGIIFMNYMMNINLSMNIYVMNVKKHLQEIKKLKQKLNFVVEVVLVNIIKDYYIKINKSKGVWESWVFSPACHAGDFQKGSNPLHAAIYCKCRSKVGLRISNPIMGWQNSSLAPIFICFQ